VRRSIVAARRVPVADAIAFLRDLEIDVPGAAVWSDTPALTELAHRAGVPGRQLVRRGLAFRDGGVEGLTVVDEAWDPGPVPLAAGRVLLGSAATVGRNRVTFGEHQLRLGRDGRWYPFRKDRAGRWNPDGAPVTVIAEDEVGTLEDDVDSR
jgi:hypothetical protein